MNIKTHTHIHTCYPEDTNKHRDINLSVYQYDAVYMLCEKDVFYVTNIRVLICSLLCLQLKGEHASRRVWSHILKKNLKVMSIHYNTAE